MALIIIQLINLNGNTEDGLNGNDLYFYAVCMLCIWCPQLYITIYLFGSSHLINKLRADILYLYNSLSIFMSSLRNIKNCEFHYILNWSKNASFILSRNFCSFNSEIISSIQQWVWESNVYENIFICQITVLTLIVT